MGFKSIIIHRTTLHLLLKTTFHHPTAGKGTAHSQPHLWLQKYGLPTRATSSILLLKTQINFGNWSEATIVDSAKGHVLIQAFDVDVKRSACDLICGPTWKT